MAGRGGRLARPAAVVDTGDLSELAGSIQQPAKALHRKSFPGTLSRPIAISIRQIPDSCAEQETAGYNAIGHPRIVIELQSVEEFCSNRTGFHR
jgi:hypothetical protein